MISQACHLRTLANHDQKEPVRVFQNPLPRRPTFIVIGIEQSGRAVTLQRLGDFPRKIRRILEPGVHALSARRAVNVSEPLVPGNSAGSIPWPCLRPRRGYAHGCSV